MNRNKLPRVINWAIDTLADAPNSFLGRIAARRLGKPAPAGTVPVTSFTEQATRVLITPVNYSEQGYAWARALEKHDPNCCARNMSVAVPGGFAFRTDLEIPVATYHNDKDWQTRQLQAIGGATHLLLEASEVPCGRLFGRSLAAQMRAIADLGVNIAYLAHGTDARLPSRQMANNPWSFYADANIYTPRLETLAQRNIDFMVNSKRPLFVSTPDLLTDLPTAVWCPVAVDVAKWACTRGERDITKPLRVVHSPSNPQAKGTHLVLPVLEKLQAEGVIEFTLLRGIAAKDMPAHFAAADVLLDQFRVGSYGVAACEAMAAGCVVLGQISVQVYDTVKSVTGRHLPIIDTTPDTLEQQLRALAIRADFVRLATAGTEFVTAVHSGALSAKILHENWLQEA